MGRSVIQREPHERRFGHRVVRTLGSTLARSSERARVDRMRSARADGDYDAFGMHLDWVGLANALADPLYRYYFRVRSYGGQHIPARGAAILVANHSGTLPLDALMLCTDVPRRTEPPRLLRPIVDRFVTRLPWAGVAMARFGAVSGVVEDIRYLLEHDELCLIFPEGLAAIGKPAAERYRLQPFRTGFAELALHYRIPVVPVAIIGPEEQWPVLAQLHALHPYGLPYVPVVSTPLPLPVRYHIHYGEPISLHGLDPEPVTDTAIERASDRVHTALQALMERGARARKGVFR